MAIDNVQAVRFCNENIRPMADTMAQAYYQARALVDAWYAQGLSAVVLNEGGEIVADNAETDGRPIVTGAAANLVVTRAQEFANDMEANSSAKLNTLLAVAVNTGR